jgi:hypothetical protein
MTCETESDPPPISRAGDARDVVDVMVVIIDLVLSFGIVCLGSFVWRSGYNDIAMMSVFVGRWMGEEPAILCGTPNPVKRLITSLSSGSCQWQEGKAPGCLSDTAWVDTT